MYVIFYFFFRLSQTDNLLRFRYTYDVMLCMYVCFRAWTLYCSPPTPHVRLMHVIQVYVVLHASILWASSIFMYLEQWCES